MAEVSVACGGELMRPLWWIEVGRCVINPVIGPIVDRGDPMASRELDPMVETVEDAMSVSADPWAVE